MCVVSTYNDLGDSDVLYIPPARWIRFDLYHNLGIGCQNTCVVSYAKICKGF